MLGKHTTSFPRKHIDLVPISIRASSRRPNRMSKRKQAEQRKLLENSMAIHLDTQCLKEALRKVPRDSSYCTHT